MPHGFEGDPLEPGILKLLCYSRLLLVKVVAEMVQRHVGPREDLGAIRPGQMVQYANKLRR